MKNIVGPGLSNIACFDVSNLRSRVSCGITRGIPYWIQFQMTSTFDSRAASLFSMSSGGMCWAHGAMTHQMLSNNSAATQTLF